MRVFTELFIDELRILVADRDYDIDIYTYEAGDPEGSNEHPYVFASTTLSKHNWVYGIGGTAEEALQDLQEVVIMLYEVAMEDLENNLEHCHQSYIEQIKWWANHWRLTTIYVPDEVADLEPSSHERWEEWYRKYDPEHIKYMVTGEYEPEEENVTYTSAGGRKTKLSWI
jgi:hypothetical protein